MEIVWLSVGILLLVVTFIDALWTTLWVDGRAGPVTSRLTARTWKGVLAIVGRRRHRTLSLFGPTIVLAVIVSWALLLCAGWTLIFASDPMSLLSTGDPKTPADWTDRIWFVAYTLSILGNGDYAPASDEWQIIASLTTVSSSILVTLVISYLLPVVGAVVANRAFAGQIAGLGASAREVLERAWDGESFRTLDLLLDSLSTELASLSEQHLSYPVLQYYHAASSDRSPAVGVVVLDEALTLLRFGVPKPYRPTGAVLHAARSGVRRYLETLPSAFVAPADEAPRAPALHRLRGTGIPTVDDEEFSRALAGLEERRRKLLGLVHNNGRTWSDW